jgi:hypothetical protein
MIKPPSTSASNDIFKIEYWYQEIQRIQLIYLSDIMKVDPQLAEIGNVILHCIIESLNNQIVLNYIIWSCELSNGHNLWLNRVNQIKQNKSMYCQIEDSIKRVDKLIARFYDVFIGSTPCVKSAL